MPQFTTEPKLSDLYTKALIFVSNEHRYQVRKVNNVPYLSHLLSVSAMVLKAGYDENTAVAALLHDSIEDIQHISEQTIIDNFGLEICLIVLELSENKALPKAERKAKYVEKVLTMSESAFVISMCDKLDNLKGCLRDPLKLFTEDTQLFYRALIRFYQKRIVTTEIENSENYTNIFRIFDEICSLRLSYYE